MTPGCSVRSSGEIFAGPEGVCSHRTRLAEPSSPATRLRRSLWYSLVTQVSQERAAMSRMLKRVELSDNLVGKLDLDRRRVLSNLLGPAAAHDDRRHRGSRQRPGQRPPGSARSQAPPRSPSASRLCRTAPLSSRASSRSRCGHAPCACPTEARHPGCTSRSARPPSEPGTGSRRLSGRDREGTSPAPPLAARSYRPAAPTRTAPGPACR